MIKNIRKAQNALSSLRCSQKNHEKELHNVFLDREGDIHFACIDCILYQVYPESQIVTKFNIEQFLKHLISSHCGIIFKEKLVENPEDGKRLLNFSRRYLDHEKSVKEKTIAQLKSQIEAIKADFRAKLEKTLETLEEEALEFLKKRFSRAGYPFARVKEILDHENSIYEEINEKSQGDLKGYLENFWRVQREMASSKTLEADLTKYLNEVWEKSHWEIQSIEEIIPIFSGIQQHAVKLKNSLFQPDSVFQKELISCLDHIFEVNNNRPKRKKIEESLPEQEEKNSKPKVKGKQEPTAPKKNEKEQKKETEKGKSKKADAPESEKLSRVLFSIVSPFFLHFLERVKSGDRKDDCHH